MFQFKNLDGARATAKDLDNQEFLPPGEYAVTIAFCKNFPSIDDADKGYFGLRFQVDEGEYAGKVMPSRFYYGDAKGFGEGKIFALIESCGFTPSGAVAEESLVGARPIIVVAKRFDKKNNTERIDVVRTRKIDDPSPSTAGNAAEPWEA